MLALIGMFFNWYDGSFFNKISEQLPWVDVSLAHMYFGRSGRKPPSPILRHLWEHCNTENELESAVADMLLSRFATAWDKAHLALEMHFDPLKSYEYTETYTPDLKRIIDKTGKDIGKITDADKDVTDFKSNNNESVFAFNSDDPQPTRKVSVGDDTTVTSNRTRDTIVDASSRINEEEKGTSITHKDGTTWVHTRQRLLKEEMELREYDLYEKIFKDIDKVLTCPKYFVR